MSTIEIAPLTAERWGDFERLFGPRGAYGGCWCMWPRVRSKDFSGSNGAQNKAGMKALVESGERTGLLAYVDAQPAGWVSLGPRETLLHFEHSRKFKQLDRPEALWSIVCFVIGKEYRGQGMMARLLAAAVDYAAAHGAQIIEAYPIEPGGDLKGYKGFTGIASTFKRAGFVPVGGTEAAPIVRLRLR